MFMVKKFHLNCLVLCIKPYLIKRPSYGKILTSNIALKRWHKMAKMVTSNKKMFWNCDSDRHKRECDSKLPARTWISPHYLYWWVVKFWWGAYLLPLRRCHFNLAKVPKVPKVGTLHSYTEIAKLISCVFWVCFKLSWCLLLKAAVFLTSHLLTRKKEDFTQSEWIIWWLF